MIRFFTFSQYHNKPTSGSTFIRVNQLIRHWPEAGLYKYGENPDALIFQKVYVTPDYEFPKHFENVKILDVCDPDWFDGAAIAESCRAVDAVTCPTQALADFMSQLSDTPVFVVPDRWDLNDIPEKPKKHLGLARKVVWFGYAHNAELLRPTFGLLEELNLKLLIISNDDPLLYRFSERPKEDWYEYKKHTDDPQQFYKDLMTADFTILPIGNRPEDKFKSNNKTTRSILGGMPVAQSEEEVREMMSARARNDYMRKNYDIIKSDYDVSKSIEQYKEIIEKVANGKR